MSQSDNTGATGATGPRKKKKKRVFKDFADYWHFVRVLTTDQQRVISESISAAERRSLKQSFKQGEWQTLLMRNACDYTIDRIKDNYGIDLLELRFKIITGKPQLIQKSFWEYVKACFEGVGGEHIAYIFEGYKTEEYDKEYIKLVKSRS